MSLAVRSTFCTFYNKNTTGSRAQGRAGGLSATFPSPSGQASSLTQTHATLWLRAKAVAVHSRKHRAVSLRLHQPQSLAFIWAPEALGSRAGGGQPPLPAGQEDSLGLLYSRISHIQAEPALTGGCWLSKMPSARSAWGTPRAQASLGTFPAAHAAGHDNLSPGTCARGWVSLFPPHWTQGHGTAWR